MPGILPYLVGQTILLLSTPKDDAVGDITPVTSPHDLNSRLANKHCLVIGGTRGIGRGIALTLVQAGASVVAVGRNTATIVDELTQVAPLPKSKEQTITAQSADLFTVRGARQLVETMSQDGTKPFDYIFFTVGCWPNYADPFTTDGIEKTVMLDVVARHAVLTSLIDHKLIVEGGVVMSTLASTQQFPFQSVEGVKKRLTESTELILPGRVPFSLMPVGIAGDAWLRRCSTQYEAHRLHFVGMFPGLVVTEVASTSFPSWMHPILRWKMWLVGQTEEAAGLVHATIASSEKVTKQNVCFCNHLLQGRMAHEVALDEELAEFVFTWLEETCRSKE